MVMQKKLMSCSYFNAPRNLKCCKPDEHLHADRLTPKEWGGWWARIETPNAQHNRPASAGPG